MFAEKSECSGSSHNPIQPAKPEALPPTVQEKKFRSCGSIGTTPSRLLDWESPKDPQVLAATDQPSLFFVCNGITGEKIPLRLVLALRVAAVKQLLEDLLQIPADDMRLSYKGRVLHDRRSLLDSGVEARQFIHVARCGRNAKFEIQIHAVKELKELFKEPLVVHVRQSDLVIEVKQQIEEITGLPPSKQRLTHGGRTLANECRLCDCGVRDGGVCLQVTSCNDVTAPIEPSIPVSGLRTPRAQCSFGAKKRCRKGTELFLTILQTWPQPRRKRLWLHNSRTIAELKEELQGFCSPEKQILMHAGRRLQDQHTLEFYNFEGGETLQLMNQGATKLADGPVALRERHQALLVLPRPPSLTERSSDVPFVDRSQEKANAAAMRVVSSALAKFTLNMDAYSSEVADEATEEVTAEVTETDTSFIDMQSLKSE